MAFPIGAAKVLSMKVQSALGTIAPGGSGAAQMRRISGAINLKKATYISEELKPSMQRGGVTHGLRDVDGSYTCDLVPGSSPDLIASVLRRDFTAVTAITGLTITVAASGSYWTLTRSTGDWLSSVAKIGMGARLTAGSFTGNNLNNNLMIISMTTTVMTVKTMNGTAMVAEGPIASATLGIQGKYTYMPTSGHTKKYWTIEEWFPETSQSHRHQDCRFGNFDIDLPGTGIAKASSTIMGRDTTRGTSQYFTSPTAVSTTRSIAAVNGVIVLNGGQIVTLTDLKLTIGGGLTKGDPVVGSNLRPDIFDGMMVSGGSFGSYYSDGTVRDLFDNGTEVSLMFAFTVDGTNNSEYMTFTLPRVVLTLSDFNDVPGAVKGSHTFEASENSVTAAGHTATTLAVQDSLA